MNIKPIKKYGSHILQPTLVACIEKKVRKLEANYQEAINTLEEIGNILYEDSEGIGDIQEARNLIEKVLEEITSER